MYCSQCSDCTVCLSSHKEKALEFLLKKEKKKKMFSNWVAIIDSKIQYCAVVCHGVVWSTTLIAYAYTSIGLPILVPLLGLGTIWHLCFNQFYQKRQLLALVYLNQLTYRYCVVAFSQNSNWASVFFHFPSDSFFASRRAIRVAKFEPRTALRQRKTRFWIALRRFRGWGPLATSSSGLSLPGTDSPNWHRLLDSSSKYSVQNFLSRS